MAVFWISSVDIALSVFKIEIICVLVHIYEKQQCVRTQAVRQSLPRDPRGPSKLPSAVANPQETYLFMEVCQVFLFHKYLINQSCEEKNAACTTLLVMNLC